MKSKEIIRKQMKSKVPQEYYTWVKGLQKHQAYLSLFFCLVQSHRTFTFIRGKMKELKTKKY